MTKKEFEKLDDAARKSVCRNFGFRQSAYINWKVEAGYFFCLFHLSPANAKLTVKPLYVDNLWWDIFEIPENKKGPMSLRGIGAFSVEEQKLAVYDTMVGDIKNYSQNDMEIIWKEIFTKASYDIQQFLKENPNADTFIPDESKVDYDDKLLTLMYLIHNDRINEALAIIDEKKKCRFVIAGERSDKNGYDYIRKWCEKNSNK